MRSKEVDLAIIGAGPAGMAAAISARNQGMENIMLIERSEYPGGLLYQCLHNGFGLHYFGEDLTGPEYAERFLDKLSGSKLNIELNTMVTHLQPDRSIIAINPTYGEFKIKPKAVVLAMGCREATRFSLMIPGGRPAGIFTAGLAQKLVNIDGYMPGKEIVILGSGDIGLIMARRLHLEGAKVKAVVELMPHVGGLIRNEVQCLNDFGIPLMLEHTVTEIIGNKRIEGVKIAKVDANRNVLEETERRIDCDCLLLSVGLIPENELSLEAGIQLHPGTGGPVVDEYLQTSVDGIFASGNVMQVWDLVDNVSTDGEKSGINAANYIAGNLRTKAEEINVNPGENIRTVTPHRIVGGGDVEFCIRVKKQMEKAVLKIGNYEKKFKVLSPTEVVKITLFSPELKKYWNRGEITVSCSTVNKEGVND